MFGTMQGLSDDEKREVLGEVLSDQLQAILEYVQDIPSINTDLRNLTRKVDKVDNRLIVVEAIVRDHEAELYD